MRMRSRVTPSRLTPVIIVTFAACYALSPALLADPPTLTESQAGAGSRSAIEGSATGRSAREESGKGQSGTAVLVAAELEGSGRVVEALPASLEAARLQIEGGAKGTDQGEGPSYSGGESKRHRSKNGNYKSDNVMRWELPRLDAYEPVKRPWPSWILDGRDLYRSQVPEFAAAQQPPLFYICPREQSQLSQRFRRVVRKRIYREIRSKIKRQWKDLYRASNTMTFDQYDAMVARVNTIGKQPDDVDDFLDEFNVEHRSNETKDLVFNRRRQGEAEIPLLAIGPMTITDRGFRFDVGTAADSDAERVDGGVGLGEKPSKPLFATRHYSVNTDLKVQIDPFGYDLGKNYVPFVNSYGVEVEVSWLSDVLNREMMTTEFTGEVNSDGRVAGFFNFVIKARK
ncbi:MAG: hypothetical protein MK538_15395 [Planctomycetes bacterium]|nr:hypothetical protein [Planctomycetota bacterium]